jgi:ribonuclease inhibitor
VTTVTLDGTQIQTKGDFHRRLSQALAFPAWYGNNLDALHDCLTDLRQDTTLTVTGLASLEQSLGRDWPPLRRVLLASQAENPHFKLVLTEN